MTKGWIVATVFGCVLVAGAITWGGISWATTANNLGIYKNQLEYVYERNFYDLTDNINNVESNLAKLKVSTDSLVQEKSLANVVALCNTAQNNMAVLPIEHNAINNTIKFVNQTSGFCLVLQRNLAQGEKISMDDLDQISSLHSSCLEIKYELNRLAVLIGSDYSIVDNIKDPNFDNSNFNNEFNGLNNDITEYPQLIYDGPFSDSTTNKTIKGLSENEINVEQAQQKLQTWFKGYTVEKNGESNGEFNTFNFTLKKGEAEFYAQITKRDGVLIQLGGPTEAGKKNKTEDECRTIAEGFARNLGFDVQAVWSTESNGFIYVNLTPVVNNVIIYPDLIKAKVDQTTGEVVGFEAKSWCYNHVERNNLSPKIDEITARKAVPNYVDVRTTRIALIPGDYVGEILTYEFMGVNEGSTYYIYIDANTGRQVNILKVVETDDGNLLM